MNHGHGVYHKHQLISQTLKEADMMTFVRTSSAAVLAGVLLFTAVGCSEPLTTREKGALVGGAGGPVS